jgi:hypothetical protein
MDIEIVVVGEQGKWVLNHARIRIGQDPNCEVSLPAGKYPQVSGQHAVLESADGMVRLGTGGGDSFLNGHPAGAGAILRSGDLLRLGAGGPELRIQFLGREAVTRPIEHAATRIISQPPPSQYEPARSAHEPTRVISTPASTVYSTPPAGTERVSHATQVVPSSPVAQPVQAAAPRAAESGNMRTIEDKLKSLRLILWANLALVALLFVFIVLQSQELNQTHKDLQAFRAQSQTAVGEFMPDLNNRLNSFDQRMDGMDAKIAAAQDRMVQAMNAQEKAAEDRMVNRMNTEIPAMLDKFVTQKMGELKQR